MKTPVTTLRCCALAFGIVAILPAGAATLYCDSDATGVLLKLVGGDDAKRAAYSIETMAVRFDAGVDIAADPFAQPAGRTESPML